MFVFCNYISQTFDVQRIIISSPDTDVAVIACYQYVQNLSLEELWFKTGTAKKTRYIAVHTICEKFGESIGKALPAFHAVTCCDSVSSFAGIRKKKAQLKQNIDVYTEMNEFRTTAELDLEADYIERICQFVCSLYDPKFNSGNNLRLKLFTRKGHIGEKLPPTLDALLLHLRRACYQYFIWKSACKTTLPLPEPMGNGWKVHLSPSILFLRLSQVVISNW